MSPFLKGSFTEYRILHLQSFFLFLNVPYGFHAFDQKSAFILMEGPMYMIIIIFLVAFKIVFAFGCLAIMCLGIIS